MIDTRFFYELSRVKVSKLASECGFRMIGGEDFEICGISTLKEATKSDLSFFGNKKYLSDLKKTSAGAVIVHAGFKNPALHPYLIILYVACILYALKLH